MPLSLTEKLKNIKAPYEFYPEQLDNLKFTDIVKNNIKSYVFPTLKDLVDKHKTLIGVDTSKCKTYTERERLFGYLYTYSVAHNIDTKKIPVIRNRNEIQQGLEKDTLDLELTCPLLFINGVDRNAGFFDNKALLNFSDFVYQRSSDGLITVLSFSNPDKGKEAFTTFMASHLTNTAEFIIVE